LACGEANPDAIAVRLKSLKSCCRDETVKVLDTLIIGAGPGGLMAATYLGRYHRRPVLIDGNTSRARWIPESHNIPGFEQGIGGNDLLRHLRDQAVRYGADIRAGHATSITREQEMFRVQVGAETLLSRYVILATGVRDRLPELGGAEEAVLRSLLRICPICDAFEATGKRIAVIGDGEHGDHEAEFLRTYSEQVTLIHLGSERPPAANQRLRSLGIRIIERNLSDLCIDENRLVLRSTDGRTEYFDVCYSALGCHPQNQLAAAAGADLDDNGAVRVSHHQLTSVAGLYAVGDLVRGLNQVVVAAAEAAIAATDIHNQLRGAARAKLLGGIDSYRR
jgi:thioredoxin reductase (NADPH)